MAGPKRLRERLLKFFRFIFTLICLAGFLYQTLEFMFIYWKYPTVVSIQKSEPRTLEMPAFTFCNTIGYNYTTICKGFPPPAKPCLPSTFNKYMAKETCGTTRFATQCFNGKIPPHFQLIQYQSFHDQVFIKSEDHDRLRTSLESYFNCEIEFDGQKRPCNMEHVMGSLYSTDELPQYCYSLYSLWGKPNKKREMVEKGSIIRFKFYLNASLSSETEWGKIRPKHNMPSSPSVQLGVHSPYTLPSPFLEGSNFLGGRFYKMRVHMVQNTLLLAPYQTNCTDYLSMWKKRGGKAPMNQLGVINECRMKKYYEALGCVPLNVDYPHTYSICKKCKDGCNYTVNDDECTELSSHYTQPCDSTSYTVTYTERMIEAPFKLKSENLKQQRGVFLKIPGYKCDNNFIWSVECSTLVIDVLFDNFEVTSYAYNPKYESLEIFSVIGGYLGMWLGISLVTVNDFMGSFIEIALAYRKKWMRKRRNAKFMKTRSNFKDLQEIFVRQRP